MHDALDPLLGFLERLLERDRTVPLLMVVAARPELLERFPAWGVGPAAALVRLAPLSREDTTRLVRSLLGSQPLEAETSAAVVRRAAGNPLYAEEFIRTIRERFEGSDPASDPAEPFQAILSLPPSIHALLASRLDALPAELRSTVQDASVVGSVVWAGAVADVDGRPLAQVVQHLGQLVDRQLLRRARTSSIQDHEEYAFRHVLVREVAYGQIPRAERARKHAAVAVWIDRTLMPGTSDRDERLAFHYAEAWDLAVAAGADDVATAVRPSAIEHLLAAGDRASRLDAPRARDLYDRALILMPPDHTRRPSALRSAGAAAQAVGDFDSAEGSFRRAIETFASTGDVAAAADTRVLLARSLFERGDVEPVLPLLREALDQLETVPRGPAFAHAATRLAGHLWVLGDHEECILWADRALELVDPHELPALYVLALQYRGASRSKLGDPRGLDDLRDALRVGRDRGLGEETAVAHHNYAYELWFHQGAWASLDAWESLVEFCEERGLATSAAWARSGLLEPAFDVGAWDRVLSVAAIVRAWDGGHGGQTQPGAVAITFQGWVALRRGDDSGAATASATALERAAQLGTPEYRAPALVLAAEVESARGNHAGAMTRLDEFLEVTVPQPAYRLVALPMVVRLLVEAGATERALGFAGDEMDREALSERLGLSLLTARAELDASIGETERALERFEEASRRWDNYGFPVEAARCGVGAGRCLLTLGRADDALLWFGDARSTFEALGARPWLEDVDRAIRDITSDRQR